MKMRSPIRVLHVVPSLAKDAGVTSVVYNLTRFSDSTRVRYDFLHHDMLDGNPRHENNLDGKFESWGCRVYRVNYASADFLRFIREVHDVMGNVGGTYDVVHCHMPNSAFCVLREAKKAGVSVRVLHSHLNTSSDRLSHRIRNAPLIAIGRHFANDYIACSKEAGGYLFRNKPFTLLHNGIDLSKFAYDQVVRDSLRMELGIPSDSRTVGCVGRLSKQKNLSFALRVFGKISKAEPSFRMIIVGDGEEEEDLKRLAVELQIDKKVMFTGIRDDVERFYSLFDCLLMPSLYEGLPVTAVEAQAAGLPCLYSSRVPAETDITNSGRFLSLDGSLDEWADGLKTALLAPRVVSAPERLAIAGYSAERNAELLMRHYESLTNGRDKNISERQ